MLMMSLRYSVIINFVGEAIVLVSVDVALETLTSMALFWFSVKEGELPLTPPSSSGLSRSC
jgi:hypothetical protein